MKAYSCCSIRAISAVCIYIGLFLFSACGLRIVNAKSSGNDKCPPAYSTCNLGKEGYVNVHLIAHTHDDVGWKSTVDEFFYGKRAPGVQYIIGIL
jgi:hypothetical protein